MAHDAVLAARLRGLAPAGLVERTVFGARCWVLDGNLAFGVHDDDLLVRVVDDAEAAASAGTRPFDPMGAGKPMRGWLLVDAETVAEDDALEAWMERALAVAATLPPK